MQIEEGLATIEIPSEPVHKGPGTRGPGFYNPSQRINRDLTISFISAKKPLRFLDAFGGSGIRGIRVAKEAGISTSISEINPASYQIALSNIKRNNVDVEIHNESFERTLERNLFDFIDIDPYGSVIPYVDKAITSVRNRGYIGATATDLSVLTGSVPSKTFRRYGAYVKTDAFKHEMGIRLLIAYIVRRAAAHDIGALPEFSFWHSHFYRVVLKIEHGAGKADEALECIGTINKGRSLSPIYEDIAEGPVWLGKLASRDTVLSMENSNIPSISEASMKLLKSLGDEDKSLLFLETTDIARSVHSNMPPLEAVRSKLQGDGMDSCRTGFSYTGLKVSGPLAAAYETAAQFMGDHYR